MPVDDEFLDRARDVRQLLNGDWFGQILVTLRNGPLHYKVLLAAIQSNSGVDEWTGEHKKLSGRVLSYDLRRLESAELVSRDEQQGVWPRSVQYGLTPAAEELLESMVPVVIWAKKHAELIDRAKQLRRQDHHRTRHKGTAGNQVVDAP